jgi:hypothetical protein
MTNKGLTYFENSRRATLAQRAYCIANPGGFPSYGPNLWGLTASDGPNNTYTPPVARRRRRNDEGTITPTAPASSIVFAPEVVLPTLHNLYENYPLLWGPYGFRDAFDIGDNWYDTDYLGIDQGPIVIMIENYMTVGKVWDRFMLNDPVRVGMTRAGFTGLVDVATPVLPAAKPGIELERIDPNPFHDQALVHYRLGTEAPVRITLHDLQGRLVADLVNRVEAPGEHGVTLAGRNLANGVYYLRLSSGGAPPVVRACVKLR